MSPLYYAYTVYLDWLISENNLFLILPYPGGNKRWWISSRWWPDLFAEERILKTFGRPIYSYQYQVAQVLILPFIKMILYWLSHELRTTGYHQTFSWIFNLINCLCFRILLKQPVWLKYVNKSLVFY